MGTTYIAIRIGVRDSPPFLFSAVRFTLAWVSFLLLGVGIGVLTWSEQWLPAGIASLIIVATPFWMALFASLGGETVRPRAVGGAHCGFYRPCDGAVAGS